MTKTILIADDSKTIQTAVAMTFRASDFRVFVAGDANEALNKLSEVKPDVVLADVSMPGKSGYDLCSEVKRTLNIPVLLLTGSFEPFDEKRAAEVQADGHIKKPFDSQSLIDRVTALVQGVSAGAVRTPSTPAAQPSAPVAASVAAPAVLPPSRVPSFGSATPTAAPLSVVPQNATPPAPTAFGAAGSQSSRPSPSPSPSSPALPQRGAFASPPSPTSAPPAFGSFGAPIGIAAPPSQPSFGAPMGSAPQPSFGAPMGSAPQPSLASMQPSFGAPMGSAPQPSMVPNSPPAFGAPLGHASQSTPASNAQSAFGAPLGGSAGGVNHAPAAAAPFGGARFDQWPPPREPPPLPSQRAAARPELEIVSQEIPIEDDYENQVPAGPSLEPPRPPSSMAVDGAVRPAVDVWALADADAPQEQEVIESIDIDDVPPSEPRSIAAKAEVSAPTMSAPRPAPPQAAAWDAIAAPVAAAALAEAPELKDLPNAALMKVAREVIERVAWEVVPELADTIIRTEIKRLLSEAR